MQRGNQRVSGQSNPFSTKLKFSKLSKLAMACLVLPVSNADSERTFSMVKKSNRVQVRKWTQLTLLGKQNKTKILPVLTMNLLIIIYKVLKVAKSATLVITC